MAGSVAGSEQVAGLAVCGNLICGGTLGNDNYLIGSHGFCQQFPGASDGNIQMRCHLGNLPREAQEFEQLRDESGRIRVSLNWRDGCHITRQLVMPRIQ